jgi:hypothetical protein
VEEGVYGIVREGLTNAIKHAAGSEVHVRLELDDDGEVVSAGVVRLSDGPATRFPIVGGSGAYRGAQGEITAGAPVKGFDTVNVLHLDL